MRVRQGASANSPYVALAFHVNRDSYNKIATQWDSARRKFYGREKDYLDVLLGELPENSLVIDVGCGTGRPMAEYVIAKGHRVVGIDQSEELIKIAGERFPNGYWILSSIEEFEFAGIFNAAILWDSLFHIKRSCHEPILRGVIGILAVGGRIMLTVGGSDHPPFTDTMFGQEFFYDSNTPTETVQILQDLGCHVLIGEFMNLPTAGRDKGRYAIVAQKG